MSDFVIEKKELDACEECHGAKGGVPGNENIINGRVLCDYCHAAMLKMEEESDV